MSIKLIFLIFNDFLLILSTI